MTRSRNSRPTAGALTERPPRAPAHPTPEHLFVTRKGDLPRPFLRNPAPRGADRDRDDPPAGPLPPGRPAQGRAAGGRARPPPPTRLARRPRRAARARPPARRRRGVSPARPALL